ncbi:hypothetical protein C6502_03505 [Candidatus Poribacteria bacterium]|nr:MAG: hypothetical protein C6502_03505 [Candidatus Poribacteria bacterium]
MEEWIQLVLFLIFGTIALVSRVLSRRGSKEEPDVLPEEEEITLPPWGNVPGEEDEFPLPEFVEEEAPTAPPEPVPAVQVASEPPQVEEETQAQSPPPTPTIAGIPLTPQTFREGIILAEILRPPKSLRRPTE